MEDKVVLISGSSAGIGAAIAKSFAKLGCKLVIHGTNQERMKQVSSECKELSPKNYEPLQVLGDFRNKSSIEILIEETIKYYKRLDVLVNNAGSYRYLRVDEPNLKPNEIFAAFQDQMSINFDSVVYLTILAIPHIKITKGCIVNISSNLAFKCMRGSSSYSSAKSALSIFTKSIAVELAPDVRVNSISPGPIASSMPLRRGVDLDTYRTSTSKACLVERVGEPEEVARLAVFLASPESGFITGSDMLIDGGSSINPDPVPIDSPKD